MDIKKIITKTKDKLLNKSFREEKVNVRHYNNVKHALEPQFFKSGLIYYNTHGGRNIKKTVY